MLMKLTPDGGFCLGQCLSTSGSRRSFWKAAERFMFSFKNLKISYTIIIRSIKSQIYQLHVQASRNYQVS